MTTASEVAVALGGRANGSGWTARCPCHMDDSPSLKIDEGGDGRVLLKCHAGCSQKRLVDWAQDQGFDLTGKQRKPAGRVVAEYDYCDPAGNVRYQVVRKAPKFFVQRRPDGKGGWVWNMEGVEPLPYRLPELLAAPDKSVFISEGEKDADRLAKEGLVATCNHGGAGKWRNGLNRWFDDRNVVILPDNDEPGRTHAEDVARKLHGIARRIRLLKLPGLPAKGDASDWLDAGHTAKELRRLAHETLAWEPGEAAASGEPADNSRQIIVARGERHKAADAGMAALIAANAPLYRRDAQIVHIARFEARAADGRKIMVPGILRVEAALLARHLGCAAQWARIDGRSGAPSPIDPPNDVVAHILSMVNDWQFKPLTGIISTPTLRPDGTILDQSGYDDTTGLVLFEPPPMPPIPAAPTKDDAAAALKLLDRLLAEFPFAGDDEMREAHRSVARSMLMTPVLRGAVGATAPLHVVRSPHAGSGKSFLSDLASVIATGELCPVIGATQKEEELEKKLHTAAMTGQSIISLDNVNGTLTSDFLAQLIERPLLLVRVLGRSEQVKITNTFTVFANGNNIEIGGDLPRRTIQCALDADMENPERRRFERNPVGLVLADRIAYFAAILTIARAYILAGRPDKPAPYMSFGGWSDLVRGALMWLGCADPVETVAELSIADPGREERVEVFRSLHGAMRGRGMTTAQLIEAAKDDALLRAALLIIARDDKSGEINPRRVGKWLGRMVNKIADGLKLYRSNETRPPQWVVRKQTGKWQSHDAADAA